jgi:hypothetical protein
VDIDKSLLYTPREGVYIDDTKTDESDRIVSIPESMAAMLTDYKAWQEGQRGAAGDQWRETGFVFTNWKGIPIRPDRLMDIPPRFEPSIRKN